MIKPNLNLNCPKMLPHKFQVFFFILNIIILRFFLFLFFFLSNFLWLLYCSINLSRIHNYNNLECTLSDDAYDFFLIVVLLVLSTECDPSLLHGIILNTLELLSLDSFQQLNFIFLANLYWKDYFLCYFKSINC